jgi:hypothetical protein
LSVIPRFLLDEPTVAPGQRLESVVGLTYTLELIYSSEPRREFHPNTIFSSIFPFQPFVLDSRYS